MRTHRRIVKLLSDYYGSGQWFEELVVEQAKRTQRDSLTREHLAKQIKAAREEQRQ